MRRFFWGLALAALVAALPTSVLAGDKEIAKAVIGGLKQQQDAGQLRGFSIDVKVEDGVVWMSGSVANQEQLVAALSVAQYTENVRQVVNGLQVSGAPEVALTSAASVPTPASPASAGPAPGMPAFSPSSVDDELIAEKILTTLRSAQNSGQLKDFAVNVSVENGDVLMSGRVKDAAQMQQVLRVAQYTPGVLQVVNDLRVAPSTQQAQQAAAVMPTNPTGAGMSLAPAPRRPVASQQTPVPYAPSRVAAAAVGAPVAAVGAMMGGGPHMQGGGMPMMGGPAMQSMGAPGPMPIAMTGGGGNAVMPAQYDHPYMPSYAWPSYASYPNYAGVTYPKQYSPTAWPYIGPFYPYPQVPLGWRKVTLEWDDGWWMLDFKDRYKCK